MPGLEPQQRAPQSRARRRLCRTRPRDPVARPQVRRRSHAPARSHDSRNGAREGFSYERKGGFNDRFAGARSEGFRSEGFAPRGDFAERKSAFAKPAKLGNGGKVFVPRDIKKRPYKAAN